MQILSVKIKNTCTNRDKNEVVEKMVVRRMLTVLFRPSKMTYDATRSLSHIKRRKAFLTVGMSLILALLSFGSMQVLAIVLSSKSVVYAEEIMSLDYATIASQIPKKSSVTKETIAEVDKQTIQGIVNDWANKYKGNASVYITDTKTGEVLATSDENRQYFTASMYKMYVAYLTLQDVDAGLKSFSDPSAEGKSRKDCLYYMIQESNSACAERMMGELTRVRMDERLAALGATHTQIVALKTTAKDAAVIARKIALGEGLSAESAAFLQGAMRDQKFRGGLPKGFSTSEVQDKVGYNKHVYGWHDTGNVTPNANKRTFTVSVFSEHIGYYGPAELAKNLQPVLEAVVPQTVEE